MPSELWVLPVQSRWRRRNDAGRIVLGALAISSPAFYFAFGSAFASPSAIAIAVAAIPALLLLCIATGMSYAALASFGPATTLDGLLSVVPDFRGSKAVRFGVLWASQLCRWIAPGTWLYLTCYYLSFMVQQLCPSAAVRSPAVMIPAAAVIALLLSIFPSRFAGLVIPVITAIQISLLVAAAALFFSQRSNATAPAQGAADTEYALDAEGNVVVAPREPAVETPAEKKTRSYFSDAVDVVPAKTSADVYANAGRCIAVFSLAICAFIASLGAGAACRLPRVRSFSMFLLIAVQCAALLVAHDAYKTAISGAGLYTRAGAGSAPLGDVSQIVGAWFFGSPRAGWWFMFSQVSIFLLTLVAGTWICLNPEAGGTEASAKTARCIFAPAGMAVVICALAALGSNYANQPPGGAAVMLFGNTPAQFLPDIPSTLLLAVSLAALVLCMLICVLVRRGTVRPAADRPNVDYHRQRFLNRLRSKSALRGLRYSSLRPSCYAAKRARSSSGRCRRAPFADSFSCSENEKIEAFRSRALPSIAAKC